MHRLVIVEPAYASTVGHHGEVNRPLLAALGAAGWAGELWSDLALEGELLRRLPFRNLVGGSLSFPAETKLHRVGFRAVNEGYRQSYGVINSDSEFVHLFGGDLDVDRSIVDLQGPEARAAQTEMKVRSMRLTLEAAIINGNRSCCHWGKAPGECPWA